MPIAQTDNLRAAHWLGKLTKLRPAIGRGSTHGPAPHKPLLLLCLLDMAERGELNTKAFTRTPGLVLRFRSYSTLFADRWPTKLDLKLPFYHLSSQGFWQAFAVDLRPAASPENCALCELDAEFHALLADADFRLKARLVLISHYFEPIERVAFFETLGIEGGLGGHAAAERVREAALEVAKRKGRSAKFQVRIVDDYRHTCALTGYRCFTVDGASIVDAAHIDGWAETQNDDLSNGLALSKSAHWMFDEGLWSVNEDLRVVVHPTRFTEAGPEALQLRAYAGRHLQFDPKAALRPSVESLRRHWLRHC
jgi:putative restriction endonuclease